MVINQKSQTDNASLHLIFDVGSQVETEGYRGISHYKEHVIWEDINKYLTQYDENAIVYNAYTAPTQVGYTLTGIDEYLNPFIYDFMNGIVNCEVSEEAFESERSIIISEYQMSFVDKGEQADLNFYRYFFNSYMPIGSANDIEDITYSQFTEFLNKYYRKPSKIIYTSKNYQIDESKLDFEMVEQDHFDSEIQTIDSIQQPESFEVELSQDYSEQENCNFIIMTDKVIEEDFPKLDFINKLIAGGLTSPLYQIREKHGLCYNLGLYLAPINYKQAVNTFYTDCADSDIELVEEKYFEIMSGIKEYISQDLIERSRKRQIINERKIAIDLYKVPDYYLYPEWNDKSFLETITVEEVHNLIDKYYLDVEYIIVNDKELYQ